jgi:hypothetical protein
MGDVPLIDADRFLQCGRPANIPEAALRERLLLADQRPMGRAYRARAPVRRSDTSDIYITDDRGLVSRPPVLLVAWVPISVAYLLVLSPCP